MRTGVRISKSTAYYFYSKIGLKDVIRPELELANTPGEKGPGFASEREIGTGENPGEKETSSKP